MILVQPVEFYTSVIESFQLENFCISAIEGIVVVPSHFVANTRESIDK